MPSRSPILVAFSSLFRGPDLEHKSVCHVSSAPLPPEPGVSEDFLESFSSRLGPSFLPYHERLACSPQMLSSSRYGPYAVLARP